MDLTEQEKLHMKYQLENYKLDVSKLPEFKELKIIFQLCQVLVKIRKLTSYPLIDRLICLVLTLLILTATPEHTFSAMKLVQSKLYSMMKDDLLASYLITYIEKDIARGFDVESIIDVFYVMKERRTQLKMPKFS